MSEETIARALESDAPLTAAVHQRDIAHAVAEEHDWHNAALVGRTVTINRPRAELYAFWRDFRNLALFMENVESITPAGGQALALGGEGSGRQDGRVGQPPDRGGRKRGPGLGVRRGRGHQERRPYRVPRRAAGRGTEVTATIAYEPPGGDLGKLIAKLFQKEPKIQARRELRRFKQLIETGEISTAKSTDAAPQG